MSPRLIVERDLPVPMRDGVILRADLYRPDTDQPLPVLLQRTPYGKGFAQPAFALMAAERGYATVIQDTRGRWNSEGENQPLLSEKVDGEDSLAWTVRQPWCNGQVGMYGASYVGYTQWAAADSRHPGLKTIIPAFTFSNPHQIFYGGGPLAGPVNYGAALAWGLLAVVQMDILRLPVPPQEKERLWGQFIALVDGMVQGTTFAQSPYDLPLIGRDPLNPALLEALAHPNFDEYWQALTCHPGQLELPALHVGGWYDTFIGSTLEDFHAMQSQGKAYQKLLVGPWTHAQFEGLSGEVDFGLQAYGMLLLPEEIMLRWFDRWLKGEPNGVDEEPPVRLFVMGANQWRDEQEWPLTRARSERYYLHSQGDANNAAGGGRLSPTPPAENEPPDHFLYDPRRPAPTRGGGLLGWQAALPAGAFDQRPVEARLDVLVYTTPPLEHDLEVTGPLQVQLWAASSAPDTDFTAKLVDVGPDGYARNLQDGIVRARCREAGQDTLLEPGRAYAFTILMAATSNLFKAGHAIRLEISSSNFPRFDRNPNTGALPFQGRELQPALQTILHDPEHPSCVVLPVIP